MSSALAVIPAPSPLPPASALPASFRLDTVTTPREALDRARTRAYDLFVVGPFEPEVQVELVQRLQSRRRSRLAPVLYLADPDSRGVIVPATYRPGLDALLRARIDSPKTLARVLELASAGFGKVIPVTAGPFELDPVRRRLRVDGADVPLTIREVEVLSVLLASANRTVPVARLIGDAGPEPQQLQVVRRHVSNIRRKLARTSAQDAVRTIRGTGYRFDLRHLAG